MTKYIVYRHGSNSANQSMTQVKPLCIVEASNNNEARSIAERTHTFYTNQYSSAVPASLASEEDWNTIMMSDGMAHLEECLPLEENIIASSEPKLKYDY